MLPHVSISRCRSQYTVDVGGVWPKRMSQGLGSETRIFVRQPLLSPCEPGNIFHNNRPTDSPTILSIPNINLSDWFTTIDKAVYLEALGITLLGAHNSLDATATQISTDIADQIRTFRDRNIHLPKSKKCDEPAHPGLSTPASTCYWILTVWTSWTSRMKWCFNEEHKYTFSQEKIRHSESQSILRIHASHLIVDEIYTIRNKQKGP